MSGFKTNAYGVQLYECPKCKRFFNSYCFPNGRHECVDIDDSGEKYENEVIHPRHYTAHPSGVECIQITEHMNFCLGNAMKYIWRAGLKHEDKIVDLQKAKWYIEREIARLEKRAERTNCE